MDKQPEGYRLPFLKRHARPKDKGATELAARLLNAGKVLQEAKEADASKRS